MGGKPSPSRVVPHADTLHVELMDEDVMGCACLGRAEVELELRYLLELLRGVADCPRELTTLQREGRSGQVLGSEAYGGDDDLSVMIDRKMYCCRKWKVRP